MKTCVLLLLCLITFNVVTSLIAPCEFGSGCRHACHCARGAECAQDTGRCPRGCDNDGTPIHAWAGRSCQIGNLAYNKPAFQSPIDESNFFLPASNAVDGFIDPFPGRTITNAEAHGVDGPAWWMVDLQHLFNIFRVDVTGSNLEDMLAPLRDSRVLINTDRFFESDDQADECGRIRRDEIRRTVPVDCGRSIPGRYVKIVRPADTDYSDILTLQEVQVFGTDASIPVVRQCPEKIVNWGSVWNPVDNGCPVDRMLCSYYVYQPFINEINDVIRPGTPRDLCVEPEVEELAEEQAITIVEANRRCPGYITDIGRTYNPVGGKCRPDMVFCMYYIYEPFINGLGDIIRTGAPAEVCVDPEEEVVPALSEEDEEEEDVPLVFRCPQTLQNTDSVMNPVDGECPSDKLLCSYYVYQAFLNDGGELVEPGSPRRLCVEPEVATA